MEHDKQRLPELERALSAIPLEVRVHNQELEIRALKADIDYLRHLVQVVREGDRSPCPPPCG